ncbi:MAG: hypothetical protein HYZ89_00530 [Candidatus Omnitrophica bacterium]|nr:hypothetical protein [Candidatus Omnitrophota bacterium]
MKPWARRLTVAVSWAMMVSALGVAVLAVTAGRPHPKHSMLATGIAAIQLVIIRYVTRPRVKAWFSGVAK